VKTTIYKTLLHSAIFLTGVAAMQAQASVAYGVKGGAQAYARDLGTYAGDNNRFYDPKGESEMYWDGLSVKASSTASVKLEGRQAASISRAWGYGGVVGLSLSSQEQITDTHYYAKSSADAESIMLLKNSIGGVAGTSGLLVLTGETYYSFSGGPIYSTIDGRGYGYSSGGYTLDWNVQTFAHGADACYDPLGSSCRASKRASSGTPAGVAGGGSVPWRLELNVRAGDDISFTFRAVGQVSAGASLSIENASPTPLQPLTIQSLSAPVVAQTAASGGMRISLSNGLSLVDTSGLVQNIDGSYGFASPVPEPETWAMLLAGLGAVGFAKRRNNPNSIKQA
jgi:hypothetical protein